MENLLTLGQKYPELNEKFLYIQQLYEKKLWHQLTEKLLELFKLDQFKTGTDLIELYRDWIRKFETKLHTLSLTQLEIRAAEQIEDENETVAFLETLAKNVQRDQESFVLAKTKIGMLQLNQGKVDEVKSIVKECSAIVDAGTGFDALVYSNFYNLSAQYYKAIGEIDNYYKEALRYLSHTPIDTIPAENQLDLAYDVGMAALTGDKVFNFGELLAHPIINNFENTDKEWMGIALNAFNMGDWTTFGKIKVKFESVEALKNIPKLEGKLRVMSLLELILRRESSNRNINFQEIADFTRTEEDNVDRLLMRALSLGLIKGDIEEGDKQIHVKWVQPRTLNQQQIIAIQDRIRQWSEVVSSTASFVVAQHGNKE